MVSLSGAAGYSAHYRVLCVCRVAGVDTCTGIHVGVQEGISSRYPVTGSTWRNSVALVLPDVVLATGTIYVQCVPVQVQVQCRVCITVYFISLRVALRVALQ